MIIILTQCFPPRIGGIENLVENLSIELSKTHEILVLADQDNKSKDTLYDVRHKNNFLINRIGGLKFFRKRKKLSELKKYLDTKTIEKPRQIRSYVLHPYQMEIGRAHV